MAPMDRPPWAITVAVCLDAVVGAGLGLGGAWFAVVGFLAVLHGGFWGSLGLIAMARGLPAIAVGVLLAWSGVALWHGAAWARWPSALLALGLVPGAVLLTVWAGQGILLILVLVGPVLAAGLFLPAARRHVGALPSATGTP